MKTSQNQRTIVGVDPGTTSALAVLDLKGNPVEIESGKNLSIDNLINSIVETGKPVLMAADKAKVPSAVEEISSNFESEVFVPEKDLSIQKKKDITQGCEYENPHERDALASALYAFNNFQNKFRNIEKRVDDLNLPNLSPEIKELVVTGRADNVSEAVEKIVGGEDEEKEVEDASFDKGISKEDLREKIDNYRKNLLKERKDKEKLREHNEKLKEKVKRLESEKESLEKDKNKLKEDKKREILKEEEIEKRERKIRSKENRINSLKGEKEKIERKLEKLKSFEELRKEGKVPLREVKNLSEEELRQFDRGLSLKNSVLLVKNSTRGSENSLDLLEELDVKALVGDFTSEFEDELISRGIWILPKEEIEFKERDSIKYLERKVLEKAKKADKGSFLDWLGRYRDRNA